MSGFFCVIEGIDGAGKSTLWQGLAAQLRSAPLCLLREPSDLPSGELIRQRLRNADQLSPEAWLQLFLEDRAANVAERILPALQRGMLVLQDRYYYSTAAYQGQPLRPPTAPEILEMNRQRGFPAPDLLLFLELSPEDALQRISERGKKQESFESLAQLQRIAANYAEILPADAFRLDGRRSAEELQKQALDELLRRRAARGP
ncbi:MAG: dTMP kinase [Leptospirales bacterium]|nr:dTMP kinase [Leptospirales bacterium]